MSLLDDLLQRLDALPPEDRRSVTQDALAATADMVWVPNPGPQTDAFWCEADELFYGGQAGGGKSDLMIGLGLTQHLDSLILRRVNDDAKDLAKRGREIAGDGHGYNGQDKILTLNGRSIRFAGCQYEDDKERFKGRAKDFYGFDEIPDFTLSQYKFITTWNRSSKPGQRCRVVAAGNPPTRPEGLWIIRYWGAWLDPKHPRPAKPGELRWYIRGENDEDVEVNGRGPHTVAWSSKPLFAKSRTFIPASLADNPDYAATDYAAMLDSLPAELRAAYRDGNFQAELKDDEFQLIPTAWINAAMERWKPDGWRAYGMTAMALDPAGGGADAAEMVWRHGGWYAPLVTVKGPETADGSAMAGRVIMHRRNQCPVVVDAGGGYGGAVALRLKDNQVTAVSFNGAAQSTETTHDAAKLAFTNKRAEAHWRFREALNPDQEGGSTVALPPDDELKADLAAPHWELTRTGIKIESKDDIRDRIGRSPGKGDAVVMAWSEGDRAVKRAMRGQAPVEIQGAGGYRPHAGGYRR
jgi:hypothetical protein